MSILKKIIIKASVLFSILFLIPIFFFPFGVYRYLIVSELNYSREDLINFTSSLVVINIILYFIILILFLLILYFIIKNQLEPLHKVVAFAKQLSKGDLSASAKFKIYSKDELEDLTKSLNRMKDRLQYSLVKLKGSYEREKKYREEAEKANDLKNEFLKKVSEELHTPLTPILSYSNVIIAKINEGAYDKDLERKIRAIRACADNMLNITSNLNELTRLETQKIDLNKTNFDTSVFLEELISLHHFSATKKSLKIKSIYSNNFPKQIFTDRELLFHILSNILTYAIHYAPEKSEITIKCETNISQVIFMIETITSGSQVETIGQIFEKSTERISSMALHLSNARLFGLLSSITNAEFIDAELTAERLPEKKGTRFKLLLDKNSTVSEPDNEAPTSHTATNL